MPGLSLYPGNRFQLSAALGLIDGRSFREKLPQFDPELIQLMRTVLEDAMTRVPLEISGTTTKAYLAEVILKAAAQGHTSYSDLITAATDQIHSLTSMLM